MLPLLFCRRKSLAPTTVDGLASSHPPPLPSSFLIVVRIRIGHASSHLLTPLLQFLLKICDATSALLDEVFRLGKVLGKVIDLDVASSVKVFDQLPVTLTNTAGGAIMVVVWVVPVQRIPCQPGGGICKQRFQT